MKLLTVQKDEYGMRYIMKIVWIFCACLSLRLADIQCEPHGWMESLIKYIANETYGHEVMFLTDLAPTEGIESLIIDELFVKVMENLPTMKVNVEDLKKLNISGTDSKIGRPNVAETSVTFFILVHESYEVLGFLSLKKLIDAARQMSSLKLDSKFLLVQVSRIFRENYEDLLEYVWEKQLIDFTLLEVIVTKIPGKLMNIDHSVSIPIVHQFNPFKKEFSRNNWNSSTKWFPDKVDNLWGHPLKIGVFWILPFSRPEFDDHLELVKFEGADSFMLKTLASKINFTMTYLPNLRKYIDLSDTANPSVLYDFLESGKVDLIATLMPQHTESLKHSTMRTKPIRIDELRAIVPVLPSVKTSFPTRYLAIYLYSVGIVAIFWVLKVMFKFEKRFWQPFNIHRLLFGITTKRLPKGTTERTLCACLLAVSAVYISDIYESVTSISLLKNEQRQFGTFEDFDESGLVPVIHGYLYNKTFKYSVGAMSRIKKKTIFSRIDLCPDMAARYKNVTCLMRIDQVKGVIDSAEHAKRDTIKMSQLRFWWDSIAFPLAEGSPYRSRINSVIGRMESSGLIHKIYKNRKINISIGSNDEEHEPEADTQRNMKILNQQLLVIAIVGYGSSIIAFVGEIIVYRVVKNKRRNQEVHVR